MKAFKVLSGVACLIFLVGTGAFAAMEGREPGTSKNPKDNVPSEIQRSNVSGDDEGKSSGPGKRSDALTGMKHEKPVKEGHAQLEKNVNKTHAGGAAMAAEELQQKSTEKSHKNITAKSAKKAKKKKAE
ncbi:MAG: hypothetical protein AB7T38_01570 [Nitrospirales bacterium]